MQLASHQWHHRCLAVLDYYGITWKGDWGLLPIDFAPGLYAMMLTSLSIVGQGTYVKVVL